MLNQISTGLSHEAWSGRNSNWTRPSWAATHARTSGAVWIERHFVLAPYDASGATNQTAEDEIDFHEVDATVPGADLIVQKLLE